MLGTRRRAVRRLERGGVVLAVLAGCVAGCDRGCSESWVGRAIAGRGAGPQGLGETPFDAMDCPDGLARCEEGVVSVSRLATIPVPCHGPAEACQCPWERVADCPGACAADGLEVVIDRAAATAQLCASQAPASFVRPSAVPVPSPTPCEEGERFECSGSSVVECSSSSIAGVCLHGCLRDGGSIDDDGVSRVAAFAILCSR